MAVQPSFAFLPVLSLFLPRFLIFLFSYIYIPPISLGSLLNVERGGLVSGLNILDIAPLVRPFLLSAIYFLVCVSPFSFSPCSPINIVVFIAYLSYSAELEPLSP